METSVRYIRLENSIEKPALCFRGRTVCHAVINDELRVRAVEIPLKELDRANLVLFKQAPYPVERFITKVLREIGLEKPVTKRAEALLRRPEEDVNLPPDEEPTNEMRVISETGVTVLEESFLPDDPPAKKATKRVGPKEPAEARDRGRGQAKKVVRSARGAPLEGDLPKAGPEVRPGPEKRPSKPTKGPNSLKPLEKPSPRPSPETANCVAILAAELGIGSQPLRVKLRAAGLRAPYVDLPKMRKALEPKK